MSLSDPLLPGSDPLSTALAPPYRFPVLAGILKAVAGVLDWLPLIAVSSLNGSYSPAVALGAGTAAGVFVLQVYCFGRFHLHENMRVASAPNPNLVVAIDAIKIV